MRSKERNGFFPLRRGRLVKLLRRTQGPGASTGMRIGGNYSKVGGERSGRAGRKSSAWPSQTPSPVWHSGRRIRCRGQGRRSRRSRPTRYSPCLLARGPAHDGRGERAEDKRRDGGAADDGLEVDANVAVQKRLLGLGFGRDGSVRGHSCDVCA